MEMGHYGRNRFMRTFATVAGSDVSGTFIIKKLNSRLQLSTPAKNPAGIDCE